MAFEDDLVDAEGRVRGSVLHQVHGLTRRREDAKKVLILSRLRGFA